MAYNRDPQRPARVRLLYQRERLLEQQERWGDPFQYGITSNRAAIDTVLEYNVEQGMTRSRLTSEQLFAAGTLDT